MQQTTPLNQTKPKPKPKLPKKVFLTIPQIKAKVDTLESRIKELSGVDNRNKRLRCLREVSFLKKALETPETKVVDPEIKKAKQLKDNMRRIPKKILKKKETIQMKKAEHNKLRRINCLYCHKCLFIRWTYYGRLQIQSGRQNSN